MTNNAIPNVPCELPTPYELATHEGRKLDESRSDGYCGSCSIETHIAQLKDPKSWVHSYIKVWEKLGGLYAEDAPSPAGVEGLEVVGWYRMDGRKDITPYPSVCATWHKMGVKVGAAYSDSAHAIIDGLRGEVAKINSDRLACWAEFKVMTRACLDAEKERDQQAQRIGELEGLLRHAQKQVPTGSGLHMRIDAALSAGKEG